MRCLYCNCTESKVIDSRSADDDRTIRRRRECMGCGRRFTTYETIEVQPILVVKNDGTRQAFDVSKIKRGIIKACEKRPVPIEKIDALADDITKKLYNSMAQEVSSKQIGEMVMEGLPLLQGHLFLHARIAADDGIQGGRGAEGRKTRRKELICRPDA